MAGPTLSADAQPELRMVGRLVEQRRVGSGLRPSELALRARLHSDPSVGGSMVRALELWGRGELATVVKLLTALEVDDATVLAEGGLDLPAMRRRWSEWAAVPEPVVMSVRLMPAVWRSEPVPAGLDQAGVLEWARSHPQWRHCLRCIRWSRVHCTYLRDDGSSYETRAVFPEDCPAPFMSLG